jgi:hypothetical protein
MQKLELFQEAYKRIKSFRKKRKHVCFAYASFYYVRNYTHDVIKASDFAIAESEDSAKKVALEKILSTIDAIEQDWR